MTIYLVALLLLLLTLGVPIAFSLGLSVLLYLLVEGRYPLNIIMDTSLAGAGSYPMLALPLYILVGYVMELGSTPRLMRLADALLGRLPGGLAVATVGASTLFGAVSGSGIATIAAVGSVTGPEMVRRGYGKPFTAALLASAGSLGVLIPPSIPLVIYGLTGNVSIGALFIGTIIPGLITAVLIALVAMGIAWRKGYGERTQFRGRELVNAVISALPPLTLPVLILGGILSGLFTATEAAAIGVAYAGFLATVVYREMTFSRLTDILIKTAITTAIIMAIIALSASFAWVITINQVPAQVAEMIGWVTDVPIMVYLLILLVLLILGTFMEPTAIIIITTPIFLPILVSLGYDPVVYGILLVMNMVIGGMSPPVAVAIYTASRTVNVKPSATNMWMLVFIVPLLVSMVIHLFAPELTLYLPRVLGIY